VNIPGLRFSFARGALNIDDENFASATLGLSLLSACATVPTESMTAAGPDFLTRNAGTRLEY